MDLPVFTIGVKNVQALYRDLIISPVAAVERCVISIEQAVLQ
jgi:hypothetical protein